MIRRVDLLTCMSLLGVLACGESQPSASPQAAAPSPLEPSAPARAEPVEGQALDGAAPEPPPPGLDAGVVRPNEVPPTAEQEPAPENPAPTNPAPANPAPARPAPGNDAKEPTKPAPVAPAPKPPESPVGAEGQNAKSAAAVPAAEVKPAVVSTATYQVEANGRMSFLIDAPLEKIKGHWARTGGQLKVDPTRLDQTRGEVTMDLSTLKITTFTDSGQNDTQAHHAKNWMEIGGEVPEETRNRFRNATFRIERVVSADPPAFGPGVLQTNALVEGKMTLHGIESTHQVSVQVVAEGDPRAPSSLRITSRQPIRLSLKHHDVKPRDLAGRFLAGALEQVGQKISDTVLVSFDFKSTRQ